jgi:hypothetical protein
MIEIFVYNKTFLDMMSINHFCSGLGLGLLLLLLYRNISKRTYFISGLVWLVVWEIFEGSLRFLRIYYPLLLDKLTFIPAAWASDESIINITGDMVTGFLGLLIIYTVFNYLQFKLKRIEKYGKSELSG